MGWINLCFLWCFATWPNIRLISGMPREKATRAQELLPPWLPPSYPPWKQNVFCLIKGQTWQIYLISLKNIIILYSGANIFLSELLRFLHELYHSQDPGTISIFHLINSETFGSWARISVCHDLHEDMLRNEPRRAEKFGDLKIYFFPKIYIFPPRWYEREPKGGRRTEKIIPPPLFDWLKSPVGC